MTTLISMSKNLKSIECRYLSEPVHRCYASSRTLLLSKMEKFCTSNIKVNQYLQRQPGDSANATAAAISPESPASRRRI
jgi:hypothetical protein